MKALFGVTLLISVYCITATADKDGLSILQRLKRDFRVPRETNDFKCANNEDCTQQTDVPQDLVQCEGGACECRQCFFRDSDSGKCTTCEDYPYISSSRMCGSDNRQKQSTAILLSLFLSSTGAANFYIESYGLAIAQLLVLIAFFISIYVLLCPCCVFCKCVDKEGAIKGTLLFIVLFILSIVFVIVTAGAIISWWIGDLVIFANNDRKTGNGCFLR